MVVLLIHTHDTGRCISPCGFPVQTPRLKELSSSGTLFRRAFTTAPTCSPSRASLFTGLYPHQAGMFGLANMGFSMGDYTRTMVSWFNKHGWTTALAGVQHIAPDSGTVGYQKVLGPDISDDFSTEAYTAKYVLGASGDWDYSNAVCVKDFILSNRTKNLFISYGLGNTHRDFGFEGDEAAGNDIRPLSGLADNAQTRRDSAGFMKAVEEVDHCVGVLLDAIREESLEEEVLVVFTTDHGPAFPFMKCTLRDSGTGISLIMRGPGVPEKAVCNEMVSNMDIFPTLCDLTNTPLPEEVEGTSLVPYFEGRNTLADRSLFGEINHHIIFQPTRSVRSERYKYIRYFGSSTHLPLANIDGGYSKDFYMKNGLPDVEVAEEELYDLYYDPAERHNLLLSKPITEEQQRVAVEMRRTLASWMERTDDPLLRNDWIVPDEGASVWSSDCVDHVKGLYRGDL